MNKQLNDIETTLWCVQCQKEVNAELTTGDIVYPHRPDLASKNFYKCPHCGNFVGCHPNTLKALGCIPTPELKQARVKVHNKLDYLWKSGKFKRAEIYKKLSKHFGYSYHSGNTKSVEECMEAIKVLGEING